MGEHVEKSFGERLQSLLSLDCVRISRILETAQYGAIFSILMLVAGLAIDALCHGLYPRPSTKRNGCQVFTRREALRAAGAVIVQVALSAVAVLYVRKTGELLPFLFNFCSSKYVPHWKVRELDGELAVGCVLIGIQTSMLEALATIRNTYGVCHEKIEESPPLVAAVEAARR